MRETFHDPMQEVPSIICEHCGKPSDSQAYSIMLVRPKLTREWVFDTLECLREWAAPIK